MMRVDHEEDHDAEHDHVARIGIVKIGPNLIATLQGPIGDRAALAFQTDLAERISRTGASGIVIDLALVDLVDSFIGRVLSDIASVSRLLGAQVVVCGMQPAVAITLTELGLSLSNIETAVDTEAGLRRLGAQV